ncbi:hypothetical protein KZP23_03925 [Echinicola marina]|uniref:hypothetical protein n=1 Tax=Echinicola marina TaxID=2859768 RepID=UPI001CF6A9F9|nr:hypothetical protein [Echinicola marina]UCS94190.1 hypothetical protein KZP23_03925 [Echinicola marina]
MKKVFLLAIMGLFLFSEDLLAQDESGLKSKSDLPIIFDFEPLKTDSLDLSMDDIDLNIPIMSKNFSGKNQVEYIDPNMRILNLSKSFKGSIKVIEVPKDYYSRMPIVKLKDSYGDDAILLPRK